MPKLNLHARIEIAVAAVLLLGSCDSLPANYTQGDDDKLEMADVNSRNAINRVNSLESRVSDIEQRLGM